MKEFKLAELRKLVKAHKTQGKKIGLVTGCFDIIHIGHIELFRFAKKHCDIVIVGLENDESIRLTKGEGRPIHTLRQRRTVLSEIESIDYVFPINITLLHSSDEANLIYLKLAKQIEPHYLITTIADKFWQSKKERAMEIGAKLLLAKRIKKPSSTSIIEKLAREM